MFMYHRLLNGATPTVKWGNGGRISVKDGTKSDNREFAVDHSQLPCEYYHVFLHIGRTSGRQGNWVR